MENELVDWARAQFALTSIYHFLFVPLTLGLSFIMAFMETIYVKTGNETWKEITQFWMRLFAVNFAIGVATGLIMEFEFGTNWANYSWFVGDIFGAPLAIEGILAFFLESTFFAVMFFGWEKVSKKFHLLSTWLVAIGSNLSALWILIANGWMQHPIGVTFNPDTVRNEMTNFWDILFSPVGVSKFLHTVGSGYIVSALFVIGISSWFLLRNKEVVLAKKSMIIGATFGLVMSLFLVLTGDESARQVALKQPVKLAAMEGLYDGTKNASLVAFGILNSNKTVHNEEDDYLFSIEIPSVLSFLSYHRFGAFIPGLKDLVYGNEEEGIEPTSKKIKKGKIAVQSLRDYKQALKNKDDQQAKLAQKKLEKYMPYFGYGYLEKPTDIIPPIALTFYSFHLMVILGGWFVVLFGIVLFLVVKKDIMKYRWILYASFLTIPLGYIAAEAGWIVAEVGRQPWAIQDLMPVHIAVTKISSVNVIISFYMFAFLFTALLIAEISIMIKQIKFGFKGGH